MPHEPLSCVLLADRHHGLTEGVRGLLESVFGSVVMVADEASLLEGAVRLRPEVAVVDLSLARDGGLSWLRELRKRCPELKVIVLSVHDEQSVRSAAMEAGADAVVLKRAIATDLLTAVDEVRRVGREKASADAETSVVSVEGKTMAYVDRSTVRPRGLENDPGSWARRSDKSS